MQVPCLYLGRFCKWTLRSSLGHSRRGFFEDLNLLLMFAPERYMVASGDCTARVSLCRQIRVIHTYLTMVTITVSCRLDSRACLP